MQTATGFDRIHQLAPTLRVEYLSRDEIAMGGPWIGQVTVNGILLPGKYSGPPHLSDEGKRIILPEWRPRKVGRFIRQWRGYFAIAVVDTQSGEIFESSDQYPDLFIEGMRENTISFFVSAHPQFEDHRRRLEFSEQTFHHVGSINL